MIIGLGVRGVVFNPTFNKNSAVSWRTVLLVGKTRMPKENHRAVARHWLTLLHKVVSSTPCLSRIGTHNLIGTDCIHVDSYKSNYHKITTTTAPNMIINGSKNKHNAKNYGVTSMNKKSKLGKGISGCTKCVVILKNNLNYCFTN